MKKLRIVVLSLSAFSLFYTLFWYIYSLVYNNKYDDIHFLNEVKIPFATNIFTILVMFILVLLWYLYHRKIRAESVSNFIMLIIFLVYTALFIYGLVSIYNAGLNVEFKEYSIAMAISSGMYLVISLIPVLLHFIASVCTGGYDNVSDPYNIYGFVYTTIGLCYLPLLIILGIIGSNYKTTPILHTYEFIENGLIYTFVLLTFILCAGLRFNMIIINIINILMEFTFVIWWIVIIADYSDGLYKYLCSLNLIMAIPLFILSIFIMHHYIKYDRFYKGQTMNFLDK